MSFGSADPSARNAFLFTIDEARYRLRPGGDDEDAPKLGLLLDEIEAYRTAKMQANFTMEHALLTLGRGIAKRLRDACKEFAACPVTLEGDDALDDLCPIERDVARAFESLANTRAIFQRHNVHLAEILEREARKVTGDDLWSQCQAQIASDHKASERVPGKRRKRKRAEDKKTAADGDACCICLEAPATCRLLPCEHRCLCASCSRKWYANPLRDHSCPICRCKLSRRPEMNAA